MTQLDLLSFNNTKANLKDFHNSLIKDFDHLYNETLLLYKSEKNKKDKLQIIKLLKDILISKYTLIHKFEKEISLKPTEPSLDVPKSTLLNHIFPLINGNDDNL